MVEVTGISLIPVFGGTGILCERTAYPSLLPQPGVSDSALPAPSIMLLLGFVERDPSENVASGRPTWQKSPVRKAALHKMGNAQGEIPLENTFTCLNI